MEGRTEKVLSHIHVTYNLLTPQDATSISAVGLARTIVPYTVRHGHVTGTNSAYTSEQKATPASAEDSQLLV